MIELIQTEGKRKYNKLDEIDKHTYYRDKQRQYRAEKRFYYLRVMRGMLGRHIDEKQLFNKNDYDYILSLNK